MGKLRVGPPPGNDSPGDFEFAIHHMLPFHLGGAAVEDFSFAPPPAVDQAAASQPVNPGFAPLRHVPLPPPDAFRPVAPPLAAGSAPARPPRPSVAPAPAFPAAGPPPTPARKPQGAIRETPLPASPGAPPVQAATPAVTARPVERPVAAPSPFPEARPAPVPLIEEEAEPSILQRFDPLYALALYLAAALGTLFAIDDLEARYVILWSLLIVTGGALTLLDTRRGRRGVGSLNMAWGIGYGALIGLPLLVVAGNGLAVTSLILFPAARFSLPALFQTLALLAPLGETIFFRGVLQERRGIVISIVGAGLGTLLFYWPSGGSAFGTLLAVAAFLTALAGLYSYIRQRYGLAAAFACQVTLNLVLFFIPRLIAAPRP